MPIWTARSLASSTSDSGMDGEPTNDDPESFWSADLEEAATAYLYSTTALLVGAALRLLSMGQVEGQRVLWGLHTVIERVARESAARDAGNLWSFAPGIEIAGIRHASLEMRLFRS